MGRGGKRPGAGRKRRPIVDVAQEVNPPGPAMVPLDPRALTSTISPKEVLLRVMRHHFERNEFQLAARVAVAVAPYEHPRLSSLEVSPGGLGSAGGPVDLSKVETLEVVRRLAFAFYLAGQKGQPNGAGAAPAGAPVVIESKSA